MKAVITNDQGNVHALKLRLVAEGANDRTLMLLLELQYPRIYRISNSGNLPESLEIPVASSEDLPSQEARSLSLSLCSGYGLNEGSTVIVRTDPWDHPILVGARLILEDSQEWDVHSLVINGRGVPAGQPCDVHPGAIVELTICRRYFSFTVACSTCGAAAGVHCNPDPCLVCGASGWGLCQTDCSEHQASKTKKFHKSGQYTVCEGRPFSGPRPILHLKAFLESSLQEA
jgi:hypothetical protein